MPHNVAIVGAGIGAAHCAAYAELPEHFHIHSVCDLNAERGRPLAEQYNAQYVDDLTKVLTEPTVDLVDICLPPHLHFSSCINALEANKHVVCEKPLVSSLREADALIQKAGETKRSVFPVFQYRYGIGMAQLLALIDAGVAGQCYAGTLETHWDRPTSYYDIDWRGTWQGEQGGAILGHAIHIHDILATVIGPVRRIYAETATRVNTIEVEDCAALALSMESGATITSSVTLGAAGNTSRIRLLYEGFTVESDHSPYAPASAPWSFVAREPTQQQSIDTILATISSPPKGYTGLFSAIADALAGQPGREVTLADGRASIEFVTAVYSSARTGEPVALPLDSAHPLYASWLP